MKKLILSILSLLLLSFTVYAQNTAPVLTDIGNQDTDEDINLTGLTVVFSDVDALDTHTITVTSDEANLAVANFNDIGSGSSYDLVPAADWNGTAQVTVTVTDNGIGPLSDSETYTVTVNPVNDAPVLTALGNQVTDEDINLTGLTVVFSDVDALDTHTITVTSDEANLAVANLNDIGSGSSYDLVPAADWSGTAQITVTVTDNGTGALSDSETYTVTVNPANDDPAFTSTPLTAATQGSVYTYNITTEDIDGDAINVTETTTPGWLTFTPGAAGSGTGVLSGTPGNDDVTGDNSVILTVSDGAASTNQSFTIIVGNINDAPTFTSTPVTAVSQGSLYTYNISTEDIDGDPIDVTGTDVPGWLLFTPGAAGSGTGILTGTPGNDDVGDHDITLSVSDGTVSVDQLFIITVNNENDPPEFTSIPITDATQDALYTYTAEAEDIDGNTLVYTAPVLPLWLDFNVDTQVLSGIPTNDEVGDHNVTLRVFDGTVAVDQTFVITVADVNDAPIFTSTPITSTSQGSLYEYTASAEDIDGDTLSYTAPVLPAWLTFDTTTHLLSGTPGNDEVGDHAVSIRVTDGSLVVLQDFVISVANENDAPTFISTPDTLATQDVAYLYIPLAEDIDGDDMTFTAPVLPEWLTFNELNQRLSGTPGNDEVGDHAVTIRVSDGFVDVDQSFILRVADVNDAPTFISLPLTSGLQDALYTYNVVAEDIDGDELTYAAPVLPAWLTFTAETQILTGTPSNDDVGDHDVTLTVSDGELSADQIFVITVANENDGPFFTSIPDTTAEEDVAYSYTPAAEDIDGGDVLSFTAPVLPEWLTFNEATQVLGGTPGNDDVGDHNVTIRVSDGTTSVDQFFVITVSNVNDAPAFTSVPITSISQNALYEYTASAEDMDGDVLTFSAPVLPGWLSFDPATHLLSGTPGNSDVGNNNITLRIFDGLLSVDQSFAISVSDVNDAPQFISTPVAIAKQGLAYTYTASAVDVDGDAVTYSAPVLPGWLTFNSSTHVLSATPGIDNLGLHDVTLRVSDGILSTDQSFKIHVLYGNSAPTFTSDPATYAQIEEVYAYTIAAEDLDGDPLTYTAPVLPDWLTFYPATHLVIGEPGMDDIGSHPITLRISDGTVAADQSFFITVFKANDPPAFTSTPQNSVLEGVAYSYTATAEDMDGDDLTYTAPFLPSWLYFDQVTHTLSGTPGFDEAGVYDVTLRVSDGNDSDDQDFTITVIENGTVGLQQVLLKDNMLLYPNPTDGKFVIELSAESESELTLEIFDQSGKLFLKQIFPPHAPIREEYNLGDQPAGLYFVRIYHDSDRATGKLILH